MDLFSMLGIEPPKPLAFTGELTAEESAKIEDLRARQVKLYSEVAGSKLIGLVEPSDEDIAPLQAIGQEQEDLRNAIWDRFDPEAKLRQAHAEGENKRIMEAMAARNKADEEFEDGEEVVKEVRYSLLQRILGFFGFGPAAKKNSDEEII